MTLIELDAGDSARITEVYESPFKEKLEEMGCYKGAVITKLYKAPLGDPIAYLLGDYTLTMRKNEARTIAVTLLKDSLGTQR
jgi:ferrous iron transport protein A